MDVISRNKRICQLIAKQLWEGLGDDEKQELQEWIQASPENKLLYDELVKRERVKQYVKKRESIGNGCQPPESGAVVQWIGMYLRSAYRGIVIILGRGRKQYIIALHTDGDHCIGSCSGIL